MHGLTALTRCWCCVRRFLDPQIDEVIPSLHAAMGPKFKRLNEAFGSIVRRVLCWQRVGHV